MGSKMRSDLERKFEKWANLEKRTVGVKKTARGYPGGHRQISKDITAQNGAETELA